MAWVNIFDAGSCDVVAIDPNDGSTILPDDWGDFGITDIRVEGGVVQVEGGLTGYVSFCVRPLFDTGLSAVRVRDMFTDSSGWGITAAILRNEDSGLDEVGVERDGDTYAPDPVEMHPYSDDWSWDYVGVVCEGSA